jgi:capsular polysaccharide biosynthesis protein
MRSSSKLLIHPTAAGKEAYFTAVRGSFLLRIYYFLKSVPGQLVQKLKLPWKISRVPKGRKKIFDANCIVYGKAVDTSQIEGRRVFKLSQWPQTTPLGFLFFTKKISDARLVGYGLILMDERGYLAEEALKMCYHEDFSSTTIETRFLRSKEAVRMEGKYISLVSHWTYWKGYYHWFMDILPRLRLRENDRRIILRDPVSSYERESLEMMGLWHLCDLVAGDHLIVEDFQFISPTGYNCSYDADTIDFVRKEILGNKAETKHSYRERLYITRIDERRCPANEIEITELFRQKGWKIVDCKKISFREQVELFSKASHVAGSHGGAFVNLLWASPDCKVFEFFPSNRLIASSENIALHLGMDYNALIFPCLKPNVVIDIDWLQEMLDLQSGSGAFSSTTH